jgi:hypothetical protein
MTAFITSGASGISTLGTSAATTDKHMQSISIMVEMITSVFFMIKNPF